MPIDKISYIDILNRSLLRETVKDIENYLTKDNNNPAIKALSDKIHHICLNIGSPVSVIPLLQAILKGVKNLKQPSGYPDEEGTPYGKGHFRWDWKAYTLMPLELDKVRGLLGMLGATSESHTATIKIQDIAVTLSAKLIASGVSFPFEKNGTATHNGFKVSVKVSNKSISFDYYGSTNDYTNNVTSLDTEALIFALYSFISDATAGNQTFEDFCSEFSYDEDSRSAKRIHKACIKSLDKYNKILAVDIYDFINELQEKHNC